MNYPKVILRDSLHKVLFCFKRHSAATILLSMGIPAKVVQEILGHSHISITLSIYAHVCLACTMKKMDDWFGNDDE